MIGRPLKILMKKTQQVATGDFSADLVLRGRDELSELATAINSMCEKLTTAGESLHKETEARISAIEQLRHTERLATLGRLSSGVAHELGTPLNVVAGRAKLIETGQLEGEEIRESTQIIREQVERMVTIIRQLLDYARRRKVKKAPANLESLLSQTVEMLNPMARKKRVTLELVKSDTIPVVSIDKSQMQQVLINLIMNGIQAMPDGGRLEVEIHLEHNQQKLLANNPEKKFLAIHIKDEGQGIAEENLNRIFDPFFTTKEVGSGTGLGLSIVYGIVQEHNGWIDVESKLGKGTCFTVYLPLGAEECKDEY
jgi:signal transduction histidine kinase